MKFYLSSAVLMLAVSNQITYTSEAATDNIGQKFAKFHQQTQALVPLIHAYSDDKTFSNNLQLLINIFGERDLRTKNLWNNKKNSILQAADAAIMLAQAREAGNPNVPASICPVSAQVQYENAKRNKEMLALFDQAVNCIQ